MANIEGTTVGRVVKKKTNVAPKPAAPKPAAPKPAAPAPAPAATSKANTTAAAQQSTNPGVKNTKPKVNAPKTAKQAQTAAGVPGGLSAIPGQNVERTYASYIRTRYDAIYNPTNGMYEVYGDKPAPDLSPLKPSIQTAQQNAAAKLAQKGKPYGVAMSPTYPGNTIISPSIANNLDPIQRAQLTAAQTLQMKGQSYGAPMSPTYPTAVINPELSNPVQTTLSPTAPEHGGAGREFPSAGPTGMGATIAIEVPSYDANGNYTGTQAEELLENMKSSDWMTASEAFGVAGAENAGFMYDANGRKITVEDWMKIVGRENMGPDYSQAQQAAVAKLNQSGGTWGVARGDSGQKQAAWVAAGSPTASPEGPGGGGGAQRLPNPSDSNVLSNFGGQSSIATPGGYVDPLTAATSPFYNPWFEKVQSMTFEYDPEKDPEYIRGAAIIENQVSQAMVRRGGLYSSVHGAMLATKLIDFQIAMRKAKYDEFTADRNFALDMAKTTFSMQMQYANYVMDVQQMVFDQNFQMAKFKADREDAAFSRQMAWNRYQLELNSQRLQEEQAAAMNDFTKQQVDFMADRTKYESLIAKYSTQISKEGWVPLEIQAIAKKYGLNPKDLAYGRITTPELNARMSKAFDSRLGTLSNMALALGDMNSYAQSQTLYSYNSIPDQTSGYNADSSSAAQKENYNIAISELYGADDPRAAASRIVERVTAGDQSLYANYGSFYASDLARRAYDILNEG